MALTTDILLERAIQERIVTALETQPAEEGGNSFTITYVFPAVDFGAGWTEDIQGPALRGIVKDINIYDVTEAFVGTTSIGPVQVGIQGGDANAYAESEEPTTLATDAAASLEFRAGVIGTIPVDEDILVTGPINVGGAITGIATVSITIKYFV